MEELNRYSTDAMHWAEQLVKTADKNFFDREEILDPGWLVGWFANYWAAVHDPLQTKIEELTKDNEKQLDMMVHMAKTVDQYAAETEKFRAENAELREQNESWEADNYNRQIGETDS